MKIPAAGAFSLVSSGKPDCRPVAGISHEPANPTRLRVAVLKRYHSNAIDSCHQKSHRDGRVTENRPYCTPIQLGRTKYLLAMGRQQA